MLPRGVHDFSRERPVLWFVAWAQHSAAWLDLFNPPRWGVGEGVFVVVCVFHGTPLWAWLSSQRHHGWPSTRAFEITTDFQSSENGFKVLSRMPYLRGT
jgi:hypothetical protein